jgi:TPR repeat protein
MPTGQHRATIFLVLAAAMSAGAQQPAPQSGGLAPAGPQRGMQAATDEAPVANGHEYVVAIGIDHYENWPVLGTAVSDATGFAQLLTTKFGFEYAVPPLTEKSATRDAIDSLIDDDLRSRLKPEDSLVIFFAGHGTTRNDKVGDETRSVGFIVPWEARAPGQNEHWSDYVNVEELLRTISTLPPAHILVILDSCHSGMALGTRFSRSRDDTRFQRDMLVKVSRKVISSAQGDQLAADQGPLADHSLFTGLMIQGLTTGKADTFGAPFVTGSQLGAYVQHEVGVAEGSRQTPLFGSFDLDEGGELIIHLGAGASPSKTDGANPASTLTKYETIEVDRMKKEHPYWQADDPLKNFPAARSAALKLCDGGDNWGCQEAAASFRTGLGGGRDYSRAVSLAQQACQAHLGDACVLLAGLYEAGETIEPDLQSATHLYQDACTQGNLRGCVSLGDLYVKGHGVARDYAQAKDLFTRACDGGQVTGCNNLGVLYENGTGLPRDYSQAFSEYQKSCNAGNMLGCENIGRLYISGTGVAKDPAQAAGYFHKGCAGGQMDSCSDLGYLTLTGSGVTKDVNEAAKLYRQACDGGSIIGCRNLGNLLESGDGLPKDEARAAIYFRKSCVWLQQSRNDV